MKTNHLFQNGFAWFLAAIVSLGSIFASSHREAPAIAEDPQADITDVYVFVSPDDPNSVTMMMNVIPLQDPNGGPNFFKFGDEVLYVLNIDNNGDAIPNIQYEFRFTTTVLNGNTFLYNVGPITVLNDANQNIQQTFSVTKVENGVSTVLANGLATPPVNIGPASVPDYASVAAMAVHNIGSTKVFAGQRDDPFYVDLGAVFDLLTIRPGAPGNSGGGNDHVAGLNVHTIALQVPKTELDGGGEGIIGVWATTARRTLTTINPDGSRTPSGDWVQVSRLALPLINEVVVPLGQKDLFNASQPVDDVANFAAAVLEPELPVLLNLIYGLNVPPTPRNDLLLLLTGVPGLNQPDNIVASDQIRLNMNTSYVGPGDAGFSIFGVIDGDLSGYPNGRRLEDDVVAISLRVMAGVLAGSPFNEFPNNALDDGVHENDLSFGSIFPYAALPHSGFDHQHHRISSAPLEKTSIGNGNSFGLFHQSETH